VEWDEGDLIIPPANVLQVQMFEVVKGVDPAICARIRGGDGRNAINEETERVVSGRGVRIRKPPLPPFDVGYRGVELDASEEVDSRPINPRFGDEATHFERPRFVT
jgi:hypothetical protein